MTITLYYEPRKEHNPRNASITINKVFIEPGPNYFTKEQIETILSYDDIDDLINRGVIDIEDYPEDED